MRAASLPRTRAMSSWYFNQHPSVSLMTSGSSASLSSSTSAFDQSIVSATPGSLNRSMPRSFWMKSTTSWESRSAAPGALAAAGSRARARPSG